MNAMATISLDTHVPPHGASAEGTTCENPTEITNKLLFILDDLGRVRSRIACYDKGLAQGIARSVAEWAVAALPTLNAQGAWIVLAESMGTESLEYALLGPKGTLERALFERARTGFDGTDISLHPSVFGLSPQALGALKAEGFRYGDLMQPATALNLWLAKGPAYGEDVWRRHYPRKDPVLAYWTENGPRMPEKGFCPEAIALAAKTITRLKTKGPSEALVKVAQKQRPDWRVGLAMVAAGCGDPFDGANKRWPIYPQEWLPTIHALCEKPESAHAKLQIQARLGRAMPITTILALTAKPKTIDAIFPPSKGHSS